MSDRKKNSMNGEMMKGVKAMIVVMGDPFDDDETYGRVEEDETYGV